MSTMTLPHRTTTITPEMITAASLLVRITHSDDASLARALGKAECRLFDLAWVVADGQLHIASHSRPRDVNLTDGLECSCPTSRGTCWHLAAWSILSAVCAAGINPVAPIPLPLCVELDDDDEPGSFLDGPFDAFDDDSLTHDEYGDVIPMSPVYFEEVDELPVMVRRVRRAA